MNTSLYLTKYTSLYNVESTCWALISNYRLDFTERQLEMMTAEQKDKICTLVEDVEYKVIYTSDILTG